MLQSITWPQYFLTISLATSLYYLFIWITFFKARFSFLDGIRQVHSPSPMGEDSPDEVMSSVQYVLDEIRPVFAGRSNRSELLMALQRRLAKYKDEDDPVFRDTINQFISDESERQCSIRLGVDDLKVVWL